MKTLRTEAIVLRRTNYGEADRIIQLLTPVSGKVSVIAKGVRKEKSKLAGGIELFATTEVTLHKGKGELEILTGARLNTFFAHILDSYEKMQFGYEVLKMVGNAVSMVPEPEWFYLTKTTFEALDDATVDFQLTELWFRLQYAALLGQGFNVLTDTTGERLRAGDSYSYDATEMGLRLNPHGDMKEEHIKLLRIATTRPPKIISKVGGIREILPVCLWAVRQHTHAG